MASLATDPGFEALRAHVRCLQHRGSRAEATAGVLTCEKAPHLAWVDDVRDSSAHVLRFPEHGAQQLSPQQQSAVEVLSAAAAAAGGLLPADRISLLLPSSGAAAAARGLPGPAILDQVHHAMAPDAIAVTARLRGLSVSKAAGSCYHQGGPSSPPTAETQLGLKLPPRLMPPKPAADDRSGGAGGAATTAGGDDATTGDGAKKRSCLVPREKFLGRLLIVLPWPYQGGGGSLALPAALGRIFCYQTFGPPEGVTLNPMGTLRSTRHTKKLREAVKTALRGPGAVDWIDLVELPGVGSSAGENMQQQEKSEGQEEEEEEEEEQVTGVMTPSKRRRSSEDLGGGTAAATQTTVSTAALGTGAATGAVAGLIGDTAAPALAAPLHHPVFKLPWFAFSRDASLKADNISAVSDSARLVLVYDLTSLEAPQLPPEPKDRCFWGGLSGAASSKTEGDSSEEDEGHLLTTSNIANSGSGSSSSSSRAAPAAHQLLVPRHQLLMAAAATSPLAGRLRELLGSAAWHPMGATLGLMCQGVDGIGGAISLASTGKAIDGPAFPEVLTGPSRLLWAAATAAGLQPRAVPALLAPSGTVPEAGDAFARRVREKHGCDSRRPLWRSDWLRVVATAASQGPAAGGAGGGSSHPQQQQVPAAAPAISDAEAAVHEVPPCSVLLPNASIGTLMKNIRAEQQSSAASRFEDFEGSSRRSKLLFATPAAASLNDIRLIALVGGARRATDATPQPVLWLEPLREDNFAPAGDLPCLPPPELPVMPRRDAAAVDPAGMGGLGGMMWGGGMDGGMEEEGEEEEGEEGDEEEPAAAEGAIEERGGFYFSTRPAGRTPSGWSWPLRAGVAVLVDVPAWGSAARVGAIRSAAAAAGSSGVAGAASIGATTAAPTAPAAGGAAAGGGKK